MSPKFRSNNRSNTVMYKECFHPVHLKETGKLRSNIIRDHPVKLTHLHNRRINFSFYWNMLCIWVRQFFATWHGVRFVVSAFFTPHDLISSHVGIKQTFKIRFKDTKYWSIEGKMLAYQPNFIPLVWCGVKEIHIPHTALPWVSKGSDFGLSWRLMSHSACNLKCYVVLVFSRNIFS
jgi:hypothetical protein